MNNPLKQNVTMRRILLAAWICLLSTGAMAQDKIHFTLQKPQPADLPEAVANALQQKLTQMLTRQSAAAAGAHGVFALQPSLEITDMMATEGMVQNTTVATAELTLVAFNRVDSTLFYSMTLPLETATVGNEEKALKALVASIEVTDRAFTRFIRISRQKIQEFYAANCDLILQKAQASADMERYEEAASYLSAMPDAAPCYLEAMDLLREIAPHLPADEIPADTVIIREVVEKPVIVEKVVEVPVEVEKTEPEKPVVEKPVQPQDYELNVSVNDLDFKILDCFGDRMQQRVTLQVEFVNKNEDITRDKIIFSSAFSDEGVELKNLEVGNGYGYWTMRNMPSRVALKQELYVTKVSKPFDSFSYLEVNVRGAKVVIRNLSVRWN